MDPLSLIIFISLVTLSAFFSGTEMALMSLSEHKIQGFVREWLRGAKSLERIKHKNDRLLIVLLIGNNVVNVGASTLAASAALRLSQAAGLPDEYGLGIATAVVTTLLLLFGEITPKSIASKYAGSVSLFVAPFYEFLMFISFPITYSIELFVTGIRKLFRISNNTASVSIEELEAFIDISHARGAVEDDEHRKIKWVLDLAYTDASSIMTPRVDVEFMHIDDTIDQAKAYFLESSHTRLPVYDENRDDVDFIVTFREVVAWEAQGLGNTPLRNLELEKIIKIPLTKPIDSVFELFQRAHKHIALVIDEYGGVAGIITMEDIIEEVFGDIKDETDQEKEYIKSLGNGRFRVQGNVLIDDILDILAIPSIEKIGLDESMLGETISYLIVDLLERFPTPNEQLTVGTGKLLLSIKVMHVSDGKIEDVIIHKIERA